MTGNTTLVSEKFNGTTLLRKEDPGAAISISGSCIREMLQDMDRPYETAALLYGNLRGGKAVFEGYEQLQGTIKLATMVSHDNAKLQKQMRHIMERGSKAIMHAHLHPFGPILGVEMSAKSEAELFAQAAGPSMRDMGFYFMNYIAAARSIGFGHAYAAILNRYNGLYYRPLRAKKYARLQVYDIYGIGRQAAALSHGDTVTETSYALHEGGLQITTAKSCSNRVRKVIDDIQYRTIGTILQSYVSRADARERNELRLG